jgi:hypothetical protein
MSNQSSIDSLAASLIQMIGSFFESITSSPSRPLTDFNPGHTSIYVIYSASGIPLSVGHVARNTTRGRQAPPADAAALRTVPGTVYRMVEVGDEVLAANLARLMVDLFSTMLPFSTNGNERRVVVNHEEQIAEVPKRRGRRPGSKGAAKGGRKRGRRAVASQEMSPDGAVAAVAEPPRRRGRKPGSKNKPKVKNGGDVTGSTPKRRGRPPGSKNRPK